MKITELRCSACDGTLKVDEENPGFAVCEYCHTKYTIEWDHPGKPGYGDAHLTQMPAKIAYGTVHGTDSKKTGWEPYGWKRGIALTILGLVLLVGVNIPAIVRRYQQDHAEEAEIDPYDAAVAAMPGQAGAESNLPEGIMADFLETVFEKPVEEVSEAELSKIQWLEVTSGIEFRRIGYSFEDPQENPDAELTWVSFPRDDYYDADLSCLPLFTGLKRINAGSRLTADDTKGLSLTGISGYYGSLEEVALVVEDPGLIRYLNLSGDPFSLQGLEQFPNLETLVLDSDHIEDAKSLVNLKSLKSLDLDLYEGSIDYSILGMMPWLEQVRIKSESIRDLGFVSKMDGLKALYVERGTFLSVAPLGGCTNLEELSLVSCDEVKDMSAISSLTGLKKLKVDLPYGCPQPDLGGLVNMEELYLERFDETGFLKNMGGLKTLTLDSCQVSSGSDFDGLVNLKTLKCTAFVASERDYSFITRLPALEEVDLRGTVTYNDISGIFNLPTLKRMNISNMQCEINFDRIAENTSLESLSIDKVKLYENVKVSGGGGIVYVDWDDVSLTENLSFLGKLKGLKELSIRENELTDLGFASSLEALQSIDFSENYVTDLAPLSGLKALSEVNCAENPISNYDILGDSVMVLH